MNRSLLLGTANLEIIDDIMFERASAFNYLRIYYLEPTEIVGELLSKSSSNERYPGRLRFFDTSKTKIGKVCVSNAAKYLISVESFKKKLHEQLQPLVD